MSMPLQDEGSSHTLGKLIAEIEQSHHAFTREALDHIGKLLGNKADALTHISPALLDCFDELQADLIPHLIKEERILFPYVTALENDPAHPPYSCFGSIANPIHMMKIEHDKVKMLLGRLRELTSNYAVSDNARTNTLYTALSALDRDLEQHIKTEDEILFPQALQLERESTP
jgi:regulator of cell morphogenesis and NO signaling